MKKTSKETMRKNEVVELYSILRELRNGKMSHDGVMAFILMRIKLKKVYDEFEKAKQEISEQTKPEGFKEGDDVARWNESYAPIMEKWLGEETDRIDTNVLTPNDFVELVSQTEMTGGVQDLLFERLVKND